MTRYSIELTWGKKHYAFFPNSNFWAALLGCFLLSAGMAGSMAWQYWETQQHLLALQQSAGGWTATTSDLATEASRQALNFWASWTGGIVSIEDDAWVQGAADLQNTDVDQFAPNFLVALTALVNALLRRLINYSLKLNNVLLLTQAKFDEMNHKPVTLKLGSRRMEFTPSRGFWRLVAGVFLVLTLLTAHFYYRNQQMQERITLMELGSKDLDALFESKRYKDDVMGFFIDYFKEYEDNQNEIEQNYRDAFLIQKQLVISKYLIKEKVSRSDQLSSDGLLEMNAHIATLFKTLILDKINIEPHVHDYFTNNEDLNKLETALMEQARYHVPASIKLAQSALETAYGRRVVRNNYFGIKDKSNKSGFMKTTEYYNAKEVKLNARKILSKKLVKKNGKMLYKCKVKDSFMEYPSPWASFRAHSIYLSNSKRYSPLFTKGKDYAAWADKIGSTKYGGVGYATSPIYGNLLKKIIRRYNLDLLDY